MMNPIDPTDLTSTPYGKRFLDLAHRNKVPDPKGLLQKYRTDPLGVKPVFIPVGDRAYWLDEEERRQLAPWLNAFEQIDRNGNKEPLIAELTSGRELPPKARLYLADLIERYDLEVRPNDLRRPAYDFNLAETELVRIKQHVEALRKGMGSTDEQRRLVALWLNAFEQIDWNGNKEPLMTELTSQRELPRLARLCLADLLDRYELKARPQRPRIPAYDLSRAESRLVMMKEHVEALQKQGMSFEMAVEEVAEFRSIDPHTLANFCQGKRGSSNRRKKRQSPRGP